MTWVIGADGRLYANTTFDGYFFVEDRLCIDADLVSARQAMFRGREGEVLVGRTPKRRVADTSAEDFAILEPAADVPALGGCGLILVAALF